MNSETMDEMPHQEPDADDMGGPSDNDADNTLAGGPKGMNQLCVPLSSLAQAGEDDSMENPTPGDKGQVNVEWTLDRVEGDKAYIRVDAVNGEELEASGEAKEPSEEQQFGDLQKQAEGI